MSARLSLTTKLVLVFVPFAVALLTAVGALVYSNGRAALQAAAVAELRATAAQKEAALDEWAAESQATIAMIAHLPSLRRELAALSSATGARVTYDPLPTVPADARQLGQVFQNLIANALKFCDGPPVVHVTARRQLAFLLGLGVALGCEVVEGVETKATWELLAALGCEAAQGYYLSRTQSAESLESWLGRAPWRVAVRELFPGEESEPNDYAP